MARHPGPVLVDTNVILECHRTDSWRALAKGYRLETVEDCVTETQTGFQRRRPERAVDGPELRAALAAVHPVTDAQRAEVLVRAADLPLDVGERSLWAHALARRDAWVLCGPDRASLRFGVRAGFRARLVALELLLENVGHRPKTVFQPAYTTAWLKHTLNQLVLAEELGP